MRKIVFHLSAASFVLGVAVMSTSCTHPDNLPANINTKNFDTTISPTNDFYQYVNGTWFKNNPIPSTEGAWGSFYILRDSVTYRLQTLLQTAESQQAPTGSIEQKVGDYYATAMDSNGMNKAGIAPLLDEFKKIDAINDIPSLWSEVAHLKKMGPNIMYGFGISPDDKISDKEICEFGQGGMSLPNKDYYLADNPRMQKMREAFLGYGKQMFMQLPAHSGSQGNEDEATANKDIHTVMSIETEMAKASKSPEERRNVHARYNKMPMQQLAQMTPNIDWKICYDTFGLKGVDTVLVREPVYMTKLDTLIKTVSLDDWKTYLKFHLLTSKATMLGDSITNINFNFWGKTFTGQQEMKPRWKRMSDATSGALGELVGQLYVKHYFSPEAKKKVYEMVHNMIEAYKQRIEAAAWMDSATKRKALAKLDKITLKLCYPDKWRDYSSLQIKRDAWVLNSIRIEEFEFNYEMHKYGKPVDRSEWGMSPQTVNAYYEPTMNEIVFPAAIMQPPFFDANRDVAMNYGGMGAVIGHEMTHGFDDEGSQYDAEGNMVKWWTNKDSTNYFNRLQVLINQFNGYELDSLHVNGHLTLGENTADLGGLTIAYYALQREMKKHPEPIKDGFTADQRFFIAFAQIWRTELRPAFARQQIQNNPHSPGMFRADGPLSDLPQFYAAFNIKPGDGMYRDSAVRAAIW